MAEEPADSIYSFDTNSFMTVDTLARPEPVWQLLIRLIEASRLYTVNLVFDELKWNEATEVLARLNPYRSRMVIGQTDLLASAGVLALNYQQMARLNRPGFDGDLDH